MQRQPLVEPREPAGEGTKEDQTPQAEKFGAPPRGPPPLALAVVVAREAGLAHQLVVESRPHWNSRSRGLPRSAFWSSSIASRSRFVSFFGTEIRTRARTSPRPEPLSFGAPRPQIRSS